MVLCWTNVAGAIGIAEPIPWHDQLRLIKITVDLNFTTLYLNLQLGNQIEQIKQRTTRPDDFYAKEASGPFRKRQWAIFLLFNIDK